jgi:hypothetical protein
VKWHALKAPKRQQHLAYTVRAKPNWAVGGASAAPTAGKGRKDAGLKTRHYNKPGSVCIGIGVGIGFEAGTGDQSAERFFAAGAALGSNDEAFAIDHDIDGIDVGLIHGGEIGVFHHDELAVAGMLLEIFLDGLLGFAHVDGEKNQSFAGKLMADFVDEGGFVGAEAAPGGPKFEENDFAFDGVVGEFFAGGCGGVKAGRGLFVLRGGEQAARGEEKREGKCSSHNDGSQHHANVAQVSQRAVGIAPQAKEGRLPECPHER